MSRGWSCFYKEKEVNGANPPPSPVRSSGRTLGRSVLRRRGYSLRDIVSFRTELEQGTNEKVD